jgi:hypothetical protein
VLLSSCRGEPAPGSSPDEALQHQHRRAGLPSLVQLAAAIPEAKPYSLDPSRASAFVQLSLACAAREYPNKPSNILDGDDTVLPPRDLTPAFFGCFDWHSAVHGHWAMVRALQRFPGLPEGPAIRRTLNRHLTSERLERELAYLQLERNKTFERPYGWAWLLRLAAELETWDDADARRWAKELRPLASFVAERASDYFPRLSVPVRAGTHANTAFAMVHMLDYARAVGDESFAGLLEGQARRFHSTDRDCPSHFEPSGEDFISPCLAEADLMRRVLDGPEFTPWFDGLLPSFASPRMRPLLLPPEVKDPEDPRIGHLIGLSLQRAWALRGIAAALPAEDGRRRVLERSAALHREHALEQMFDSGYGGEHWLASFALYLLTDVGMPPR